MKGIGHTIGSSLKRDQLQKNFMAGMPGDKNTFSNRQFKIESVLSKLEANQLKF